MPGPAPAVQRRRTNEPARGDWVDLPALEDPVLPDLPEGTWSFRTKNAWESWRKDPATTQYGPADIQLALDLAYIYETWVSTPDGSQGREGEIRQRLDGLGLTPKGRQDRRWRYAEDETEQQQPRKRTSRSSDPRRARLSVVK